MRGFVVFVFYYYNGCVVVIVLGVRFSICGVLSIGALFESGFTAVDQCWDSFRVMLST